MKTLFSKIKSYKWLRVLKNFYNLLFLDVKREIENLQIQQKKDYQSLLLIRNELRFNILMDYYKNNPNDEYKSELSYLSKIGTLKNIPYEQLKEISGVNVGFDKKVKLPYVMHGHDRLFFPKNYSTEQAKSDYIKFIQSENILGGNYTKKAPHQYQSNAVFVKEGDTILDIGSAEALFALDNVYKAKRIYVFESNPIWWEPLKATFGKFKGKVVLINKTVSTIDSSQYVRIDTCLEGEEIQGLFIRMDIEGEEKNIIKENEKLLTRNIDIRISCASYHRHDDSYIIESALKNFGYKTENSEGYMLFLYDQDFSPPFFRRGIIRAYKI